MNILLVDDDNDKARTVARLCSEEFVGATIEDVTNARSAKQKLLAEHFDLLIIDIALPPRVDAEVEMDGGITLLEEIITRGTYNVPPHIIGITALPEVLDNAIERFSRRSLSVIRYEPNSDSWMASFRARLQFVGTAIRGTRGLPDFLTETVIVAPLEQIELDSVQRLPWQWEPYAIKDDYTAYYRGYYSRRGERKIVIAASPLQVGMAPTAALTMKMIAAFRPRFVVMTGILAGTPGRVRFGDVIVADPCWDYGLGKWIEDADGQAFKPAPKQLRLDPELRHKFAQLANQADVRARIRESWPGERPDNDLVIHLGPVASGAAVIANDAIANHIGEQHGKLLGIEMEAYGLFAAADEAPDPRPKALVIKSVADFADSHKNDRFQRYAAYSSSKVLQYFLENIA